MIDSLKVSPEFIRLCVFERIESVCCIKYYCTTDKLLPGFQWYLAEVANPDSSREIVDIEDSENNIYIHDSDGISDMMHILSKDENLIPQDAMQNDENLQE